MATALRPLRTALYAALNVALPGKVFAQIPEPAPYPFVSLGSVTEFADDSHDAQGLNALAVIHVWDKAPSDSQLFDMFATVDAALDRVALSVVGFRDVSIKHNQHQVIDDPDPDVRHINAQYQIRMTKE